MATRTCPSDRSSLFASSGGTDLGGGNDPHLPVGGPWSGYTFRSAVQFALDWTGVVRLTKATLRIKVSTQVHVGFSSAPDIYVRRCTASWSANSSSGSSDGGSGWGTSPTVYPGPAATTTGQVSKRIPTSEATFVDIDVTTIARAWAPSSVEGGGGSTNYGVLMLGVASGDITEFSSHKTSDSDNAPKLILTYDTDAPPPAPAITGPTGTVATVRPTLTATAVDPDGDPLQAADVEVRKAAAVVYSSTGSTAGVSSSAIAHVPTSDLPSGDLLVRMRAKANGVYGAWSADSPFTIDRAPTAPVFTAPTGNVSSTRRPVHTFSSTDADGDPLELFDLEIYRATAGAPDGGAVYAKTSQAAGISGMTVSHTPTVDLPGGDLLARSRVRTRGVWSSWSSYRAYTVVIAFPSITWSSPSSDGAYLETSQADLADVTTPVAIGAVRFVWRVTSSPPAAATITKIHVKVVRTDGPAPPATLFDADVGITTPAGPTSNAGSISIASWAGALSGAVTVQVVVTASNGGITDETRVGRWNRAELITAVALGDQVTALAGSHVFVNTDEHISYRAQSSPTSPYAGAPWRGGSSSLPTVGAELPPTNAYLGIRIRMARHIDDADLLAGSGSFEVTVPALPPGWTGIGNVTSSVNANAVDGTRILRIQGDGSTGFPSGRYVPVAVIPGATYRLSGWAYRGAGTINARIAIDTFRDGVSVANDAANFLFTLGTPMRQGTCVYTVPTDGSVNQLRVRAYINGAAAATTETWAFDALTLTGPQIGSSGPGVHGVDRLALTWKSLG